MHLFPTRLRIESGGGGVCWPDHRMGFFENDNSELKAPDKFE